jgi:hypothetical protein
MMPGSAANRRGDSPQHEEDYPGPVLPALKNSPEYAPIGARILQVY